MTDPARESARDLPIGARKVSRGALGRKLEALTRVVRKPIPAEELAAAERILACLVARAFAVDHSQLLASPACPPGEAAPAQGPELPRADHTTSGPSSAARADAVAPAAKDGGPEH
jgi:hypothetical protein